MIEVTVKTLDSQNHSFCVPDDITVKEFKEKIASSVGITADKQRLIFCGRVLQDEKKLSEFDVNGKVIHLVQRPPPHTAQQTSNASSSSTGTPNRAGSASTQGATHREGGNFLLGAFTIPQDMIGPAQVEQIVQDVVSGMGEIGRNATVMSRTSDDGSSVDVHINLGHVPLQSAAQLRIQQSRSFINRSNQLLDALENGQQVSNDSPMQTDQELETPVPMEIGGINLGRTMTRSSSDTQLHASGSPSSTQTSATNMQPRTRLSDALSTTGAAAAVAAAARAAEAAVRVATGSALFPNISGLFRAPEPLPNDRPSERSRSAEDLADNRSDASATPTRGPSGFTRLRRDPNPTRPNLLGSLMEEVARLQTRLQPHLDRYVQTLNTDPELSSTNVAESQQLFNTVSQILHYISHVYHSASDLYVNYNVAPPRTVRARFQVQSNMPTLHQSIPIQRSVQTTSASTGSSLPAPVFNPQSPLVFMEVGPGTIIIDSISTAVSGASGTGAASSAQGTENANATPNSEDSNPSGANTIPTTSGSTGTRSSSVSAGPSSLRTLASLPFPGLGQLFNFDPCLPCNSRWAINRSQGRPSAPPASAIPQPEGPTGARENQDDHLHHVISNFMAALINQPRTFPPGQSGPAPGAPPATSTAQGPSAVFGTIGSVDSGGGRLSGPIRMDQMNWLMEQMIQQRRGTVVNRQQETPRQEAPNLASSVPSSNPTNQPSGVGNLSEEMITLLIQAILGHVSPDQSQITVGEFLTGLEDYSYTEGENIISDLFMCVARILTFRDFVGIFFGQTEPLNRVQNDLKAFVCQNILHIDPAEGPPSDAAIDAVVERLVTQASRIVQTAANEANVKPEIDYEATVNNFMANRLRCLITFVLQCPTNNFGNRIFELVRLIISEFAVLSLECFQDREVSLERVIQTRIRQMTTDVNPMLQQWVLSIVGQEVRSIMNHVTITPQSIRHYIVRRQTNEQQPPVEPAVESASQTCDKMESRSTNEKEEDKTSKSEISVNGSNVGGARGISMEPTSMEGITPELWHSAVPQDWVPVITCDVQRQRRQAPQSQFSDGYMNGMPSKRRKIMAESQEVLRPVQTILPEALTRAIASSGVSPVANMDALLQEARQDTNLHAAYREQVIGTVRNRLHRDLDYAPERFPNSEQYYCRPNGTL